MDLESKIKELAEAKPSQEICGFVLEKDGELIVLECDNIAQDKKEFYQISHIDVLNAYKNYDKMISIFHSHVHYDETPSEFDLEMSEHFGCDFWIYSLKTRNLYKHNEKN